MEDYSNFSQEAIRKSMDNLIAEVQIETGATNEEIQVALVQAAYRIMNTNFMKEPRERK